MVKGVGLERGGDVKALQLGSESPPPSFFLTFASLIKAAVQWGKCCPAPSEASYDPESILLAVLYIRQTTYFEMTFL
jgi:hypothetical protein